MQQQVMYYMHPLMPAQRLRHEDWVYLYECTNSYARVAHMSILNRNEHRQKYAEINKLAEQQDRQQQFEQAYVKNKAIIMRRCTDQSWFICGETPRCVDHVLFLLNYSRRLGPTERTRVAKTNELN